MNLLQILQSEYVSIIAGGLGGVVTGWLTQRVLNRRGIFSYSVTHNRVGITAEDPIFGNVAVSWNGNPVQNLGSSRNRVGQKIARNAGKPRGYLVFGIFNAPQNWHHVCMANSKKRQRRLWDAYAFPGVRPQSTVRGVFGDPKARVIILKRRSKKQSAGAVVERNRVGTTGVCDRYAILPVATCASTWRSRYGACSAEVAPA